jgi:Protein of unknown function (DUF1688)
MSNELATILDPATIRARTARVLAEALAGGTHFSVQLDALPACIDFVMEVTKRNYPDGKIPLHGRAEHLRAGGVDRLAAITHPDRVERARTLVDLVLVSVLLDAGAGNDWSYVEDGVTYSRSEGLAVASAAMFRAGMFGPGRVDAEGLDRVTVEGLSRAFQVTPRNPLLAVEGRVGLLNRLAAALRAAPDRFPGGRPGGLVDVLLAQGTVTATALLQHLLVGLAPMWPARVTIDGVGFGDVWPHGDGLVPFHKLSQWLTYSLIEPVETAGVKVEGVDALTGLPEYRNGGLFLDFGVLTLRDPALAAIELEASHPAIIEWRALTVQLLDRVGAEVQRRLGRTSAELPLACVLQGGTWSAGREIAKRRRPGGVPPLTLKSDGMVF